MSERDEHGRFLPGHAPKSPGRPSRAIETLYLEKLVKGVPQKKWEAIIVKAVEQAIAGDFRARAWLSSYLIGKPPMEFEAEMVDGKTSITIRYENYVPPSTAIDDDIDPK